jgi:putative ABC transport system permease protein
MAALLTIVVGLGLMGTMSLNVLERTREIGILRSIGATDRAIRGIVVSEGVLIGLIGWVIGSLQAVPITRQIDEAIGQALFSASLDFAFPMYGVWWWLAGSVLVAALSSFGPAWSASRLAVRDILNYE